MGQKSSVLALRTVLDMSSAGLASTLAAFMVAYHVQMVEKFEEMRCRLEKLFNSEWIIVEVFTDKDEDAEKDREDILAVLLEACNARVGRRMGRRFGPFVRIHERISTKSFELPVAMHIPKNFRKCERYLYKRVSAVAQLPTVYTGTLVSVIAVDEETVRQM